MTELDERIRRSVRHLAGEDAPTLGVLDRVTSRRSRLIGRRHRRIAAGVISLALLGVFATDRTLGPRERVVSDSPPATTATTTLQPTTTVTTLTTSTTTVAGPQGIGVLRPDGLGSVDFGTPATEAIAVLEDLLGAPTFDSGVDPAACPIRTMTFLAGGLRVDFGRLGTGEGPSRGTELVFERWSYGRPDDTPGVMEVMTTEGIGLGSAAADVEATLGPLEPDGNGASYIFVYRPNGNMNVVVAHYGAVVIMYAAHPWANPCGD